MNYSPRDIEAILGVTRQELGYWRKHELIRRSTIGTGDPSIYNDMDLFRIALVRDLHKARFSREMIKRIMNELPNDYKRMTDTIIASDGLAYLKIIYDASEKKSVTVRNKSFIVRLSDLELELKGISKLSETYDKIYIAR